jgi:hypothetical protein
MVIGSESLIPRRIAHARRYIEALEWSQGVRWPEEYQRYVAGNLEVEEAVALAHPMHYGPNSPERVRGQRSFGGEPGLSARPCGAERLWGYTCPRIHESALAADHLFPYALGGPTLGTNKLYLCSFHNQVKTSDIHLYPWEEGEPPWLAATLKLVHRTK